MRRHERRFTRRVRMDGRPVLTPGRRLLAVARERQRLGILVRRVHAAGGRPVRERAADERSRNLGCPDAVRPSAYLYDADATMRASSVEDKPPIGMVGDDDDTSGRDRDMMRVTRKGDPIDAPNG